MDHFYRLAVLATGFSCLLAADARFEISFPAGAHAGSITGRVYLMIAGKNDPEPRLQIGRTGAPFFGRDVEKLAPGQAAVIDASDLGSPVLSLSEIPAGDYWVQAFVNVYSEYRRSDGHVVWMHDDQWEGQHWNRSPGNLYSKPQRVTLDGAKGYSISLICDQVIAPVAIPPDTAWVKRFRMQSPMLTKFWGRPIFLGATVLLPRDYDQANMYYPVLYQQGHFSLAAPLNFDIGPAGKDLHSEWVKDSFPRMIVVTLQHPNPYFDDSYAVNSVNVGPYGNAILQELIPEIEKRFRISGSRGRDCWREARPVAGKRSRWSCFILTFSAAPGSIARTRWISPKSKASTFTKTRTLSTNSSSGGACPRSIAARRTGRSGRPQKNAIASSW